MPTLTPVLTPEEAAYAADRVYNIIHDADVSLFGNKLNDKFNINSKSRFKGVAGSLVFKYQSGFGLIAKGIGEFKNDAIVIVRGTNSIPRDLILTDGNIGIQTSSTGSFVHSGFNKVFNSFEHDIRHFFTGFNPERVHCVGHSLGGALATLVADWVAIKSAGEPILYTFGSPRVGMRPFAERFTQKVKEENIYRVYHKTDVVSMVPLWPFIHVPQPGTECYIDDKATFPWITYHSMEKYIDSVSDYHDWTDLKKRQPIFSWDNEIDNWLKSDSPLTFTANTLHLINNAIIYVLKKILNLTGIAIQTSLFTGPLTILDQIAMTMERAVAVSKEASIYVVGLMKRILSALGHSIAMAKNITRDFIRWVLTMLSQALYRLAYNAIEIVHR